jgi:hypothetical protein
MAPFLCIVFPALNISDPVLISIASLDLYHCHYGVFLLQLLSTISEATLSLSVCEVAKKSV